MLQLVCFIKHTSGSVECTRDTTAKQPIFSISSLGDGQFNWSNAPDIAQEVAAALVDRTASQRIVLQESQEGLLGVHGTASHAAFVEAQHAYYGCVARVVQMPHRTNVCNLPLLRLQMFL